MLRRKKDFSFFLFKPRARGRLEKNVEEDDKIINLSLFLF